MLRRKSQIGKLNDSSWREENRVNSSMISFSRKKTLSDRSRHRPSKSLLHGKKLKDLIGLESVKKTIEALLDSIQYNYQRELQEKPLVEFTLNRVFLGSPGTGKTTVAKLFGQILVDIGMLSNGEGMFNSVSHHYGTYRF